MPTPFAGETQRQVGNEKTPDRKPPTPLKKLPGLVLDKAVWNTRLAATMVAQLGALHPWRVNGKWRLVLEPWAVIHDDPRQLGQDNNIHLDRFSDPSLKGVTTLDERHMPEGEIPTIVLDGLGLQKRDHNRIDAALGLKKRIVVNISRDKGTFN